MINKDIMEAETIADILKITLPALIVFFTAWIILRNTLRNDREKRQQEIILQNSKIITPIKLQAYERVVLFLERISPESLLIRISSPGMSAAQLQSALLTTIRNEFEHNLSQQIYMSPKAWEIVKNARTGIIKIINTEYEELPQGSTGLALSKKILEKIVALDKEPTHVAIDFIKAEVAKII